MRAIAVTLAVAVLVLSGAGGGWMIRSGSGTYVDPAASKRQLDFTVQPQRPPKKNKQR